MSIGVSGRAFEGALTLIQLSGGIDGDPKPAELAGRPPAPPTSIVFNWVVGAFAAVHIVAPADGGGKETLSPTPPGKAVPHAGVAGAAVLQIMEVAGLIRVIQGKLAFTLFSKVVETPPPGKNAMC